MPPVKRPPHKRAKTFLREWRLFRDLSLEAVADMIEVDHSTLQRLEVGNSPYKQDMMEALAVVYMCSTTDLISVDPTKADSIAPVVAELRKADPRVQKQAIAVLEAFLKAAP